MRQGERQTEINYCLVFVCSVIMETDPAVLTQRIAIKVDDTEQSVRNVRI